MICPCKGCTRRTAAPNCHAACDEYQAYAKEREIIRTRRQLDRIGDEARIRRRIKQNGNEYRSRKK